MGHQATEKQSKNTLSWLIGTAIFLVVLMSIALFLMFNWAKVGTDIKETREQNIIEQKQDTT